MKRTRRSATRSISTAAHYDENGYEDEGDCSGEINVPKWQDYISEETRTQWDKLHDGNVAVQLRLNMFDPALFANWHYQYTVSWLYKVCDSYLTLEYGSDLDTASFKPMWRDIKFDELFLLEDLSNSMKFAADGDYYDNHIGDEEDIDEADTEPLSVKIRLRLLRTLSNNKSLQLRDWDVVMSHHLATEETSSFDNMSLIEQFEMIYQVIKLIEVRNMTFKNCLSNNLSLFEFHEYVVDEQNSIIALPNVGVLVWKKLTEQNEKCKLIVPIKLNNCTISYQDDDKDTRELVHIDYANDIDRYLNSFKIEFSTITSNWESFLEKFSAEPDLVNFEELIPIYAEHQLYIRRILLQREKEKSMAQLLTRRKRSSRLVAKEEETRRKQLENAWYEKLDSRELFLKDRNKLVAKQMKKYKDYIWNQLWLKFEQDLKVLKLTRRNDDGSPNGATSGSDVRPTNVANGNSNGNSNGNNIGTVVANGSDLLTALDLDVISNGPRYTESVIMGPKPTSKPQSEPGQEQEPIPDTELADSHQILELPAELLISDEELEELANFGISTSLEAADKCQWIFQDPSEPLVPAITIASLEDEEANMDRFQSPIVCCDKCLRWQRWESDQTPQLVELRTCDTQNYSNLNGDVNGNPLPAAQKDYGLVQLNNLGSRRSVRAHSSAQAISADPRYLRPTDKRKPLGEVKVFICSRCLAKEEHRLRELFLPELKKSRAEIKRRSEERERKVKLKEQKKKLALEQQAQAEAHAQARAIAIQQQALQQQQQALQQRALQPPQPQPQPQPQQHPHPQQQQSLQHTLSEPSHLNVHQK
ncbi:hypothetical protein HG535_0G04280 [Zygotorulaspora mrakii]|uniref:Uncharacterized protein n=1 Tax=Zygotorulaspora mrakii TaxID=42260 RepID=A0A7H9B737_ZYGMR|nr:uncharacterized protein HG535_0G04280 [Zygotorulaspora mrakii]QLG74545.1 hypothetical protein HG535_0G04280 [Zygotorulaspora mrakii]